MSNKMSHNNKENRPCLDKSFIFPYFQLASAVADHHGKENGGFMTLVLLVETV